MLEEKAGYLDDLPINVRIVTIRNYPLHYHYDHEFIYVLRGFVTLKCGSSIYKMQQGDIFVSNESEVHGLYDCSNDNIVLMIQINTSFFIRFFPTLPNNVYRTMRKEKTNEEVIVLRNLLLKIAMNHVEKRAGYKMMNTNIMMDVLSFCDRNFKSFYFEGRIVMHKKYDQPEIGERIGRTIDYIYKHHHQKLSLKDLAEKEHFSEWYMSRLITAGTGLGFRELLAFARVEESEKLLLSGTDKVSSIAAKVGFSTTAYYEKFFKKWFGCHPDEYRNMYSNKIKGGAAELIFELGKQDAMLILADSINFLALEVGEKPDKKLKYRELDIDLNQKPLDDFCPRVLCIGRTDKIWKSVYNIDKLIENLGISRDACSVGDITGEDQQYALDSLLVIPYMVRRALTNGDVEVPICSDSGEKKAMLSGRPGMFTIQGIQKPMYHGCRIIRLMEGELLSHSEFHIATRKRQERQISILFFNSDQELEGLCEKKCSMRKVQKAIDGFNTESLDVKTRISGLDAGIYQIIESTWFHKNSLFYFAYQNNYTRRRMTDEDIMTTIEMTVPHVREKEEYFDGETELEYNLKGICCKLIRIIRK